MYSNNNYLYINIDSNLINEVSDIIQIFQKCIESENEELTTNILKIILNVVSNSIIIYIQIFI